MIAPLCQHATRDEAVLCPFYRPLKAEQIGQCHGPNAFDCSSLTMPKPQHSPLDPSASAMMHATDTLTSTHALHDSGAHGPAINGHAAAELCDSCGEPAQRQCPCGAQICARHFYDAEGAQARGAHGFCAECVDLIREQQHGEERYGVAGGA